MADKQYSFLAGVYDSLNSDFDYDAYAKYLDREIRDNEKIRSSLVLDLACGTGKITFALRDMGYDMTGVDLSEDMLSVARDICYESNISDILWLCHSKTYILPGTEDMTDIYRDYRYHIRGSCIGMLIGLPISLVIGFVVKVISLIAN